MQRLLLSSCCVREENATLHGEDISGILHEKNGRHSAGLDLEALASIESAKLASCHTLKKTDIVEFYNFTGPQIFTRSIWCVGIECDKAEALFEEVQLGNSKIKQQAIQDRRICMTVPSFFRKIDVDEAFHLALLSAESQTDDEQSEKPECFSFRFLILRMP